METGKKIEIVSNEDDTIKIKFTQYPIEIINGLRRTILDDIDTLTVDSCALDMPFGHPIDAQSIISTRMALVPFKTLNYYLQKLYNFQDCKKNLSKDEDADTSGCTGCRQCGAEFIMKMDFDSCKPQFKDMETGMWSLTSGDFIIDAGVSNFIKPAFNDIVLMKFNRDQKIFAQGWLRKGNGDQHSKWSPVSVCYHQIIDDQTILLTIESNGCFQNSELIPLAIQSIKRRVSRLKSCVKGLLLGDEITFC